MDNLKILAQCLLEHEELAALSPEKQLLLYKAFVKVVADA